MPAGKTHDKITWGLTPLVFGSSWYITHHPGLSLTLAGSFCFAGLMFSGDLDTKSVQYKRWGWFRWLWLPYQQLLKHRSPFSHGVMLGSIFRLFYLSLCLGLLFWLGSQLGSWLGHSLFVQQAYSGTLEAGTWFYERPIYVWSGFLGLWLGGLSHTAADETGSWLKRWRTKHLKRKKKRSSS